MQANGHITEYIDSNELTGYNNYECTPGIIPSVFGSDVTSVVLQYHHKPHQQSFSISILLRIDF
jgi:hypothetical protein